MIDIKGRSGIKSSENPKSGYIRPMKSLTACVCLTALGVALAALAQEAPVSAPGNRVARPTFEVASVKASDPNPANSIFVGMAADPARVRYANITLRDCIRGAFRVRDFQIAGPEWMASARFEIDAKLPPGASTDQIPEMLQSLLAERFKLATRRGTKEMSVYALLVGNGGAKLKPTQAKLDDRTPLAMGTDGKPRAPVSFGGTTSGITINAPSSSLLTFVGVTSRFTARPIVDMTGIDGLYDFTLTFVPEVSAGMPGGLRDNPAGASDPAPTLSEAVKQYGLRIEPRKASIEMLIVTRIEKTPTEN
jgi:uncharacterized protein (TIGR03435 family)